MAYCIMRTDKLHGTTDASSLVNVKIPRDLENGVIVKIGGLAAGERDAYDCTVAAGSENLNELAILCGPEMMYDERKKNLNEYINEVVNNGGIYRAYKFFSGDFYSLTKEGFVTAPTASDIGKEVAVGADGKVDVDGSGTKFGKIVAYEAPYFVIEERF